uniref:CD36 family protein n=1 Tax=Parastrongyloides trichosuri TaxID=131310 RepID=A0A0N4ZLX4_PARTI
MWPESKIGKIILYVILIIIFIIGLILLIPVPLAIFPAIVSSQLVINPTGDSTWGQLTNYWWKLPMDNHYDFVLYNITNPDAVNFYGEKAALIAVGPYSYQETEIKDSIFLKDNGTKVFFRNIKTWTYKQETSCKYCDWEDELFLPNPAFMTVAKMVQQYNVKGIQKIILEASLYLLGEYPVRKVSQKGVLFLSYNDPLISFLNSDLMKLLMEIGGTNILGFPPPDIKHIGYFPLYNNTNDEDYLSYTGSDDAKKLGKIINWSNSTQLRWWKSDYANNLLDVTDGTFNGAFIDKDADMRIFQSFACRHFQMENNGSVNINDIPATRWKAVEDNFNPYNETFKGYEYPNDENATYFPDWPCGSNGVTYSGECDKIDCSKDVNFCSSCCKSQNIIDNKIKLPRGIIPLACFPGLNKDMVFYATISPPNFGSSPKEVRDSMIGINYNPETDNVGYFDIQDMLGSTVSAFFRVQLNIPIYNSKTLTQLYQHRSVMFPCFALTVRVSLKDYALTFIRFVSKIAPLLILIIGIICTAIPVFTIALIFVLSNREKEKVEVARDNSTPRSSIQSDNSIELIENANYANEINEDYLDF